VAEAALIDEPGLDPGHRSKKAEGWLAAKVPCIYQAVRPWPHPDFAERKVSHYISGDKQHRRQKSEWQNSPGATSFVFHAPIIAHVARKIS